MKIMSYSKVKIINNIHFDRRCNMNIMKILISSIALLIISVSGAFAQLNKVKAISVAESDAETSISIISDSEPDFNYFLMTGAEGSLYKLIVDVSSAVHELGGKSLFSKDGIIKDIRSSQWKKSPSIVRIVAEINEESDYRVVSEDNVIKLTFTNYTKTAPAIPFVLPRDVVQTPATKQQEPDKLSVNTLTMRQQPISSVVQLFQKAYNMNIIVAQAVDQNALIDVFINDEYDPVNLLETILIANNYKYVIRDNIYLITGTDAAVKGENATELFTLRYIDANDIIENLRHLMTVPENIQAISRRSMGSLALSIPTGGGSAGGGAAGGASGGGAALQGLDDFSQAEATAAGDERSDMLMVHDRPDVIETVREYINILDIPVPQVHIEVKMVETRLGENEKWGLNWTTILETVGLGGQPTGSGQQTGATGGTGVDIPGIPIRLKTEKVGTLSFSQFKTVLELLSSREDSKLLNQPSITTMHNQEANIAVGTVVPIEVTQIGGTAGGAAGGGGGSAGGAGGGGAVTTLQYKNINIALKVIPQVNSDKEVTLYVKPVVEEITGFTGRNNDLPITSTRTTTTQIRVKDGDTVMIGGLIKEDKIKRVSSVKFLGSLPLLGNLFRSNHIDTKRSELVIFISPSILPIMDVNEKNK